MNASGPPTLPETCGVAFKEWEGVCEALARGRQSLILRKGGIEEGPGGFAPEHPAFWLYPTRVHQAQQGLKPEAANLTGPETPDGTVGLHALAVVSVVGRVEDPARLAKLDALHVWTDETIRKRFDYRTPGLWVLGVAVFHRAEPIAVPVTPAHAGCKTWVPLETAYPTRGLVPALDPAGIAQTMSRLAALLAPDSPRDDPR